MFLIGFIIINSNLNHGFAKPDSGSSTDDPIKAALIQMQIKEMKQVLERFDKIINSAENPTLKLDKQKYRDNEIKKISEKYTKRYQNIQSKAKRDQALNQTMNQEIHQMRGQKKRI